MASRKSIISYGLIAFYVESSTNKIKYILHQQRDTFYYVTLIRGVYNQYHELPNILSNMTIDERKRVRDYSFDELWNDMFINKHNNIFKKCYTSAKHKYDKIKGVLPLLLDNTESIVIEPPWGFPKGKKNKMTESDKTCIIREFEEETCLCIKNSVIINDDEIYNEKYTGTDGKEYMSFYYVGEIPESAVQIKYVPTPNEIRKLTVSDEAFDVQGFYFEETEGRLSKDRFEILKLINASLTGKR